MDRQPRQTREHPAIVRITHWIAALAMVGMITSGWQIYNASPLRLLPFTFPAAVTLGGWLGGGLLWHFAAMWALIGAGAVYLVHGFATGHFRRDIRPAGPRAVGRDLAAALRFRLHHERGAYNAVQRLLYALVLVAVVVMVASGLSIWKPVQLGWLTAVFGGYDTARYVHFALMCAIVAFLVVHVALVALVPRTLVGMVTGGARLARGNGGERP